MIFPLPLSAPAARFVRSHAPRVAVAFAVGIACLALVAEPTFAAKRHRAAPKSERPADPGSEAAESTKAAEAPRSDLPSEIVIAPHFSPEQRRERERREAERLRALAPRAEAWTRAFRAAGVPFAKFVDETLRTLHTAIGRGSRNVCFPLQAATERLAEALPQAPDDRLERDIRAALARVANGARICLDGRPTSAQTEIRGGAMVLARAAETIVNWGR